jgi:HK97 family phage portal protein
VGDGAGAQACTGAGRSLTPLCRWTTGVACRFVGLFTKAMRPPDVPPNANDPITAAPGTVGPPNVNPGDPDGVIVEQGIPGVPPPTIVPSAWSGWPAEWWPVWGNVSRQGLTDIAWKCLDLNSSLLSTMPPYLVDAAPTLDSDWLNNPEPLIYTSWEEFAKQLFWDYQLGEAFVLALTRYATGWPARFRVIPPWMVEVDMDAGTRRYRIGGRDVTSDMLHVRYSSTIDDAHGHGPLEAGASRLIAADVFARYATSFAAAGGVPTSVLEHPEELTAAQAAALQAQWVQARTSSIGEPAVLSGGVTWSATQINPKDMALVELSQITESRIAVLLGVPPFLVGLPSGGDPMTYSNVTSIFDYHWRAGLRPQAQSVMSALSQWLLPRGTKVEVNRDAYIQPEPYQRAQTAQILNAIVDPQGNPALTVDEIRANERLDDRIPT